MSFYVTWWCRNAFFYQFIHRPIKKKGGGYQRFGRKFWSGGSETWTIVPIGNPASRWKWGPSEATGGGTRPLMRNSQSYAKYQVKMNLGGEKWAWNRKNTPPSSSLPSFLSFVFKKSYRLWNFQLEDLLVILKEVVVLSREEDKRVWAVVKNGIFSIKSNFLV